MEYQVQPIDRSSQLHFEEHVELLPDMGRVEWSQTDGQTGDDQYTERDSRQKLSHHDVQSIAGCWLYNRRSVLFRSSAMKILMPFVTLLLLTACATGQKGVPPAVEPEPQSEVVEITSGVHWMRNSAEYRAIMLQTYALASERLRTLAAGREPGTWAIASDADETILDNSHYSRELILSGQQTSDERWDAWVARRAAPPLAGAVPFLELVHELGGYVAIVTNRRAEHCGDTRANFRAFDIPFDVILCREDDRRKEDRWQSVEAGTASPGLPPVEILLWVGDNIQDFPGLDQSLRFEDDSGFAEFAERFFVVPNPTYGSWMSNPED